MFFLHPQLRAFLSSHQSLACVSIQLFSECFDEAEQHECEFIDNLLSENELNKLAEKHREEFTMDATRGCIYLPNAEQSTQDQQPEKILQDVMAMPQNSLIRHFIIGTMHQHKLTNPTVKAIQYYFLRMGLHLAVTDQIYINADPDNLNSLSVQIVWDIKKMYLVSSNNSILQNYPENSLDIVPGFIHVEFQLDVTEEMQLKVQLKPPTIKIPNTTQLAQLGDGWWTTLERSVVLHEKLEMGQPISLPTALEFSWMVRRIAYSGPKLLKHDVTVNENHYLQYFETPKKLQIFESMFANCRYLTFELLKNIYKNKIINGELLHLSRNAEIDNRVLTICSQPEFQDAQIKEIILEKMPQLNEVKVMKFPGNATWESLSLISLSQLRIVRLETIAVSVIKIIKCPIVDFTQLQVSTLRKKGLELIIQEHSISNFLLIKCLLQNPSIYKVDVSNCPNLDERLLAFVKNEFRRVDLINFLQRNTLPKEFSFNEVSYIVSQIKQIKKIQFNTSPMLITPQLAIRFHFINELIIENYLHASLGIIALTQLRELQVKQAELLEKIDHAGIKLSVVKFHKCSKLSAAGILKLMIHASKNLQIETVQCPLLKDIDQIKLNTVFAERIHASWKQRTKRENQALIAVAERESALMIKTDVINGALDLDYLFKRVAAIVAKQKVTLNDVDTTADVLLLTQWISLFNSSDTVGEFLKKLCPYITILMEITLIAGNENPSVEQSNALFIASQLLDIFAHYLFLQEKDLSMHILRKVILFVINGPENNLLLGLIPNQIEAMSKKMQFVRRLINHLNHLSNEGAGYDFFDIVVTVVANFNEYEQGIFLHCFLHVFGPTLSARSDQLLEMMISNIIQEFDPKKELLFFLPPLMFDDKNDGRIYPHVSLQKNTNRKLVIFIRNLMYLNVYMLYQNIEYFIFNQQLIVILTKLIENLKTLPGYLMTDVMLGHLKIFIDNIKLICEQSSPKLHADHKSNGQSLSESGERRVHYGNFEWLSQLNLAHQTLCEQEARILEETRGINLTKST